MMRRRYHLGISLFSVLPMLALLALKAMAQEAPVEVAIGVVVEAPPAPTIDTGDNAWMMTSSALVLAMTIPGLALFYGGMSRAKNVGNTLWMNWIAFCITSMMWVLWSYSLAFAPSNGFIGGLQWAVLGAGRADPADYVGQLPSTLYATTIPPDFLHVPVNICRYYPCPCNRRHCREAQIRFLVALCPLVDDWMLSSDSPLGMGHGWVVI